MSITDLSYLFSISYASLKLGKEPKIVAKLQEISKLQGVESLEQCHVAMRLTKVAADKILPEIKVVGNGWISLMGYQSRGYAYIQP